MGTWGPAIFSDDLACDLRADFRDAIADGKTPQEALAALGKDYPAILSDPDEAPVFWLSLAATAWELGRLEDDLRDRALEIISSKADLARWEDPKLKSARQKVLDQLAQQLRAPQKPAKKLKKRRVAANDWAVGEVLGLHLKSGNWTLLHVTGHHTDKGGKFARCELLDWTGSSAQPGPGLIDKVKVVQSLQQGTTSDFILAEPSKKADLDRLHRLGVSRKAPFRFSAFRRKPGALMSSPVILWSRIDELFLDLYGVG